MDASTSLPVLTTEQERALDEHGGMLQGPEYVVMRPAALLRWLGCDSPDELRQLLQPAFDEIDRGEVVAWDVEKFLDRMHRSHEN